MFARLMIFQWLAGIAAAVWISPKTWIGATSQTHWHVWAAIFLGGTVAVFPVFLGRREPGRVLTRHAIAVAQMLTSALLIHLTGGRIETHFHVFGSLAMLAFYRDWRVIVTATVVVAVDHMARGIFWPQSVFGVLTASPWRWVEHAGWVIFEDTFLLISIRQGLREMFEVAVRRASLETVNGEIENQVAERTAQLTSAHRELQASEERFSSAFEDAAIGMALVSIDGRWLKVNRALCDLTGYGAEDLCRKSVRDITHPDDLEAGRAQVRQILAGETHSYQLEKRYVHKLGQVVCAVLSVSLVRDAQGQPVHFITQIQDISQRKEAEAKVEETHRELLEVSRFAGMAEVATGVLHNVGNVLNSVNVTSSCLAQKLQNSKAVNLSKVVELLREHEANLGEFLTADSRGRQLPDYLARLTKHLAEEQAGALRELGQLQKNIDHIKDIVAMQQSYARVSGVAETLKVSDLVEDALRMNSSALDRHEVEAIREFADAPPVTVERHKVLQILINLIRNAKYACDESGRLDKRMTVRIESGGSGVKISIIDNGVGILPENMTRIFNHGFTTRKDGHGFGLHTGALAARELGGTLIVTSPGPGHGASFTLELPYQHKPASEPVAVA